MNNIIDRISQTITNAELNSVQNLRKKDIREETPELICEEGNIRSEGFEIGLPKN